MENEIKFDHTKEKLHETFGVTEARKTEITNACKESMIEFKVLGLEKISNNFEYVIEKVKPQTPAEYLLIGYCLG